MGQLLASGILKAFVAGTSEWSYRVPYAIQWIWPIPISLVTIFAPESPWWLVRHGKLDQARRALLKLTSKRNSEFNVEDTLAMMIHTNELEIQQTSGTSYIDCFKGVDLRRTELTVMTWVIQQTCGSPMIGWGTYFMEQAGLTPANAFSLGVGQSAMGFVGTVGSWFLMPHFGRRTLYLWGQGAMFVILMIIGGLGIPPLSANIGWATGALILILTFAYDLTVGPVCYSLVAELPSTRLRIKTVVLARNVYNVCGIVIGTLQPRFMNPTAWNWRGKTAFFWGGLNLLGNIWTYFRLPEPKVSLFTRSTSETSLTLCRDLPSPTSMSSSRTTLALASSARSRSIRTAPTTWSSCRTWRRSATRRSRRRPSLKRFRPTIPPRWRSMPGSASRGGTLRSECRLTSHALRWAFVI